MLTLSPLLSAFDSMNALKHSLVNSDKNGTLPTLYGYLPFSCDVMLSRVSKPNVLSPSLSLRLGGHQRPPRRRRRRTHATRQHHLHCPRRQCDAVTTNHKETTRITRRLSMQGRSLPSSSGSDQATNLHIYIYMYASNNPTQRKETRSSLTPRLTALHCTARTLIRSHKQTRAKPIEPNSTTAEPARRHHTTPSR